MLAKEKASLWKYYIHWYWGWRTPQNTQITNTLLQTYFKILWRWTDPNNNQWNKSLFSSNQCKMYKYNFKKRSRRFWGSSFLQVYWNFHNIDCVGIIQQKCLLSVMPLVLTGLNTWNAFFMSATTNLLQRKMMTVMIFCISWDQSLIPSS